MPELDRSIGDSSSPQDQEYFPGTQWTTIEQAGGTSPTVAQAAIEKLCRLYWSPLYGFVRRQGYDPEEARDLTQEFFARLLEREGFKQADKGRGRFRTFLLSSLKHFLVSEWRKGQATRRRSGPLLSLDAEEAERSFLAEPADELSPDKIFEKRWALSLLDQVLSQLRKEYTGQGRADMFRHLSAVMWSGGQQTIPYTDLALQLGTTEGAVGVAVHRLRRRYLELLRAEVAGTMTNPAEVDEELRYLLQVLAG